MPAAFDLNSILNDPQVVSIIRIVIAGLIGGLIGLERELAGKAAGIRTYGLVSMGAAMFACVAVFGFGSLDFGSRIVGSIITGIGFLGAGTILHTRQHVVGLTTAAGMWVAAGLGMAVGLGLYVVGIGAAVLLFSFLQFARPEELIRDRRRRAGLGTIDPEDDFHTDEDDETRTAPTQPGSPQPVPVLAVTVPQGRPPTNAWPASIPAPTVYGPWSTAGQQQAGQTERR